MDDAEDQRRSLGGNERWEQLRKKMISIKNNLDRQTKLLMQLYNEGNSDLKKLIQEMQKEDELDLLRWFVGYRSSYLNLKSFAERHNDPELKKEVKEISDALDYCKNGGIKKIQEKYKRLNKPPAAPQAPPAQNPDSY